MNRAWKTWVYVPAHHLCLYANDLTSIFLIRNGESNNPYVKELLRRIKQVSYIYKVVKMVLYFCC